MVRSAKRFYWYDENWGSRFKSWLARRNLQQKEFAAQIAHDTAEVNRAANGKGGLPVAIKIAAATGMALPRGVLSEEQCRILRALEEMRMHLEAIHGPESELVQMGLEACVLSIEMLIRNQLALLPDRPRPTNGEADGNKKRHRLPRR